MASSAWRSWSSWGINIFIEAREIPGSLQLQKYYSPGKKLAWNNFHAAYWIGVGGVANLNMHGSRTIDGQGSARWLNKQANNLDVQFAKSFLELLLATFFIFCVATSNIGFGDASKPFNVLSFGAVGDGKTDDSPAFTKAWGALCGASGGTPTLVIPPGRAFSLKPVKFEGPCKSSSIHIQVAGNIVAPSTVAAWGGCGILFWLCFSNVNGLVLDGSGHIDGRGSQWWNHALLFNNNSNLKLSGLNVVNSPRSHVSLNDCKGVSISGLKITAPGNSPNTDGIDVSSSSHVSIVDSTIGTGDDCIAIKGGCSNINITGINCGPGHGISIGSIGENGATERVEEVHVRNCNFTGTENGARIKTVPGGSGYVRRITFEQITLNAAGSPIIIDQRYCDGKKKGCPDQVN
ncbi:probable polygalacturonase At3g15720 [Populus alba]|uniref:probable polygalacturonase At3g15720 n=1 Tax=Populus alba TaxID=43335 RepID=UPI00158DBC14|nr:probable polygalacturonase At3g15720 [Populus alba]